MGGTSTKHPAKQYRTSSPSQASDARTGFLQRNGLGTVRRADVSTVPSRRTWRRCTWIHQTALLVRSHRACRACGYVVGALVKGRRAS